MDSYVLIDYGDLGSMWTLNWLHHQMGSAIERVSSGNGWAGARYHRGQIDFPFGEISVPRISFVNYETWQTNGIGDVVVRWTYPWYEVTPGYNTSYILHESEIDDYVSDEVQAILDLIDNG